MDYGCPANRRAAAALGNAPPQRTQSFEQRLRLIPAEYTPIEQ
jgi:hypothetical protein